MECRASLLLGFILTVHGVSAATAFGNDLLAERRAILEKLSAAEKDELRRNHERLIRLDPEKRRRLQELDRQLAVDPEGEQLRQVMLRYHEWLRALPSAERAELLSLSEADRIPRIRKMLIDQETIRLRELAKESLSPTDVEQVRAWFNNMVQRAKPELLSRLPPHLREELARSNDVRRLIFELTNHRRDNSKGPPVLTDVLVITDEDRQELVAKLSAQARDVYRRANTEQDKSTVLQNWAWAAMYSMYSRRTPSPDELRELLQRLPPETRDRIENLPPEQMTAELNRMFFYDRMRRWGPDGKRPPFPGDRFKERGGGESFKRPPPREDSGFKAERAEAPPKFD